MVNCLLYSLVQKVYNSKESENPGELTAGKKWSLTLLITIQAYQTEGTMKNLLFQELGEVIKSQKNVYCLYSRRL